MTRPKDEKKSHQITVGVSEKLELHLRDLAYKNRTSKSAEARSALEAWDDAEAFTSPEVEKRLRGIMEERGVTRISAVNIALSEWVKGKKVAPKAKAKRGRAA